MAIIGSIETVRAHAPRTPAFAAAWKYIGELQQPGSAVQQRIARLVAGGSQKHELGDGVFVIEQAYATKPRPEGFFEAHRKYIDLQVIVSGHEVMEVVDVTRATVKEPLVEQRDLIVYHDAPAASILHVRAGEAAIFFPVDVHMPSIRDGAEAVLVHKAVLKVPVNG